MNAHHNQKNTTATLNDTPETQLETSWSARLSVYTLSFLLAGQPLLASAQTIIANTAQTQQITAPNGVPVINIATPSAKGVSHNKFRQFNVDPTGLILNNATAVTSTQLAGFIDANPNLVSGQAANLIINEVIDANRSQLNGFTEVAGQQANVVIANPYGISCNGCGFINTPRATLTTGIPQINNGGLTGFNVTNGDIRIEGLGLNAENISQFDIISRAITINADIHAQNINMVTGNNQVAYENLTATAIANTGGAIEFALDSSALGGMYANAIRLIGTEAGVGVRLLGNMASSVGDLTLSVDGKISIANTQSAGKLTLYSTTASIELNQDIFSEDVMNVHANTAVNNHGSLSSNQSVKISATSLNNNDINSEILSGGTLDIMVNSLTNTQSRISAEGDLALTANTINNTANAVIQGQNVTLTSNGDIVNQASEINSLRSMTLTADNLNNSTGVVTSQTGLAINVNTILNNTQGGLHASQNIAINASSIENESGKIETHSATSTLNIASSQINNQGGRIVNEGNGLTQISSINGIENSNSNNITGGGQIGGQGDVVISATDVNNIDGAKIIAGNDLTLNITDQLTNTGGELNASHTLNWQQAAADFDNDAGVVIADNVTITVASTSNQSGRISSTSDLVLQTALTGNGDILAGRDASIELTQNYANSGGQIKANRDLSITGQGSINNAAVIEAVNDLRITATTLTNQSSGVINAKTTTLIANGEINNSGHIEGDDLNLTSSDLTNTGSFLADNLTFTVTNLTNDGALAFIGATNQLDLLVQNKLINRDGALIYSLGNLTIAADKASTRTNSILNSSANIEADGDLLSIYSHSLTNKKNLFTTALQEVSRTAIPKVYLPDAERIALWNNYWPGVYGKYRIERVWKQGDIIDSETAIIEDSAPALIRAANTMDLHVTNTLSNAYSDIVAGNALNFEVGTLNNIAATKETKTQEQGSYVARIYKTRSGTCHKAYSADIYSWCNASASLNEENSTFGVLDGGSALFSGNKTLTGSAWTINNINENETAINNGAMLDSNQSISANPFTFSVPTSRLFLLRPDPESRYLVETVARFTNFGQFISSDYMLSRLNLDPELIPKRLGDGFYEQRLILEQLRRQTGHQYLDNIDNGKTQYTALMDAGIAAAQSFNLTPTIALTQQQIAALTKTIVWMENETIKLADGSTATVLVPKVYLGRVQDSTLSRGGAIMVADTIQLSINGVITNSGSIDSQINTVIAAIDINNIGGRLTSDGDIELTAQHNITNSSGTIKGDNITLSAAGDIINNTASGRFGLSNRSSNSRGKLQANNELNLTAANDIIVQGADLNAGHDVTLTAGRHVEIKTSQIDNIHGYQKTTQHEQSTVTAGGALNIAANDDISIKGADLTANNIDLKAQNIAITAAADSNDLSYRGKNIRIIQKTTHQASSLNAKQDISLQAEQNIDIIGSHVIAKNDISLQAKGDTTLAAAQDNYYFYSYEKVKRSFGRSKTATQEHYTLTNVGSEITVGNNLTINADITDSGITRNKSGQVLIESSDLIAGKQLIISADDGLTITAKQDVDYSKTTIKKSGFLGLSKSVKSDSSDVRQLAQSNAATKTEDLSLLSGEDITLVAANIDSATDLNIKANGDIIISAGLESETTQHLDAKSSFLSGGNLFEMEKNSESKATVTAKGTQLKAGNNVNIEGSRATIIGSDVIAGNDINAHTDVGDINVISAQEELNYASEHEKASISIVDGLKSITSPQDMIKFEDGQLKIALGEANYDKIDTASDQILNRASQLLAGHDINLHAAEDILIEGSDITADTDQNQKGDINLGTDTGNVIIKEAVNTQQDTRDEIHAKAEVSVVIQNDYVEAAKAVKSLVDAKDNLKQVREDYRQYDKDLSAFEQQTLQLEQDYNSHVPGVSFDDVQESKALLDDMGSDDAWYQTGIVTAAMDVISKTTLLTQKIATAASSTTTYGFDAGIQLDIHADKTKSDTHSTTSRGSTLTAQNISIDTGTEHAKADTSTTLQGSKLQANQNIDINTGELNVLASKDTHTNRTKTKAIDASINQTFYGSSTGLHVNVSASESESKSRSTTYTNSQLLAGDTLAINTTGDAIINGGNLDAKVIKADIGGNLTIESKQNRNSSSNKSRGISAGFGTDNNSALSSVNGGVNFGNGRSNEKHTVRSSVTANHVDITVAGHTQLTGSTLAATDIQRNDTGKLTLATNTFDYQNLTDSAYNKQTNGGISINNGLGETGKSTNSNQAKDAKGDKTLNVNSSNIQYKNEREQSRTTALATLGQGELILTSDQDAKEATLGLNRDVSTTEKDIFDVTRTQGNIDVTVDHRLLTKVGQEEIKKQIKDLPENVAAVAENLFELVDNTAELITNLFPNGITEAERYALSDLAMAGKIAEFKAYYEETLQQSLSEESNKLVDAFFAGNVTIKELYEQLKNDKERKILFSNKLTGVDGTANNALVDSTKTNVAVLIDAYKVAYGDGKAKYIPGVGTGVDFGFLDKIVCGVTGCGGQRQIDDALIFLAKDWDGKSMLALDFTGFSRGAATTRTLINTILNDGIPGIPREMIFVHSAILFDSVGSDGLPGNNIDLGHDFSTSDQIGNIWQATAGSEYRNLFDLQSLARKDGTLPDNAQETAYPGAHADIGGRYQDGEDGKSNELSNVILRDAYAKAAEFGLNLGEVPDQYKVSEELDALYTHYRATQTHYQENTNPENKAKMDTAYDNLAKDYIHDSRYVWERWLGDRKRDIYYPNSEK